MSTKMKIQQKAREIESAQSKLDKGIAGLYLGDGRSRYSESEERRMKRELAEDASSVLDGVGELIDEGRGEISKLQSKSKLPTFVSLDSVELRQAGAILPFVKDDTESLPLSDLAERVEAVTHHGDVLVRRLYDEHVARRLATVRSEMQRTVSTLDGNKTVGANRHDPEHVTALSQAHKALRESLPPDRSTQLQVEALQESMLGLSKAKSQLSFAIGEVNGLKERVRRQYQNF